MNIQEWDIELADVVSLNFYDIITVQLTDGREIPIWSKDSEHRLGEADPDSFKLVFISKMPISIKQAESLQNSLRGRIQRGWYHQIH
ncbi:hypothetical protein PEQA60_41630 [Pseudomonas sp. Eqa60]|jgi:hypothetical protein|uniref:hypothetical protein n=1 Tax=Pseudomonas sp. Eqa60 TaxID=2799184 RepID=UPI001BB2F6FB|nr:hypothetical protein [Pseudomonas sp. Eqa60]BCQ70173.1 hypothetical protein PEQA60_41630 [Pseudomonas sp. Eqa60]